MNEFEKRRREAEVRKVLDSQVDGANELLDDLRAVLLKYAEQTTLPMVVGVLETLKFEVLLETMTYTEEI